MTPQQNPHTVSVFTSTGALSKRFSVEGDAITKTAAAQMVNGHYEQRTVDFSQLPQLMDELTANQALAFGIADQGSADICLKGKENPPQRISRTREYFHWPKAQGVMMLDFDAPGLSQAECGAALAAICPKLAESAWFVRGSVSAGVHRADELPGDPKSWHLYVLVEDAADIPRAGQVLFDRLWLAGHGKVELSKAGSFLVRGLIDASVWQPERLDFAGKPVLGEGLAFTPPTIEFQDGVALDTKQAMIDLCDSELRGLAKLVEAEKNKLKAPATKARAEFARTAADAAGLSDDARAEFITGLRRAYIDNPELSGDFMLHFATLGQHTVRAVLADPARYDHQPLLDPLTSEPGKTMCYCNADGSCWVHSFAHGGATYRLVDDRYAGVRGMLTFTDDKGKAHLLPPSQCATKLLPRLRGKSAYDAAGGLWAVWKGTHWHFEPTGGESRKLLADLLDAGATPKGWRPALLADITKVLEARQLLPMPAPTPGLVSFANGVLDSHTGELHPHAPAQGCTWALPWRYDPAAQCPTIVRWLTDATGPATADFLLAWLAASVQGVELQKFLFLHGPGGTGKSTFIRLAQALVGPDNCHVSSLPQLEGNRFELAALVGKRLLVIPDAGRYCGAVDTLKSITGGDPLRLERKFQQPGNFTYHGLTLLAANEPLASTDHTSGLERRRLTVEFTRRVSQEQRLDWEQRGGEAAVLHAEIPGLVRMLLGYSTEAICHAIAHPPLSVMQANYDHEGDANPIADWAVGALEFIPGAVSQIGGNTQLRDPQNGRVTYENADALLYPSYLTHCLQSNRHPVALNLFVHRLVDFAQTRGHTVTRHRQARTGRSVINGMRLRLAEG